MNHGLNDKVRELTQDRVKGLEHLRTVIKKMREYLETLDDTTYDYVYSATELEKSLLHLIPTARFLEREVTRIEKRSAKTNGGKQNENAD